MKKSIVTVLLLIGIFSSLSFADSVSSTELQKRGIVNVQEYIQKIRETGKLDNNISNKALDNLFQSIELFKKEKKLSKIILSELNIADIYRINKIEKAYSYYQKVVKKSIIFNDNLSQAKGLLGIAKIEMNQLRNYGTAEDYINKALVLIDKTESKKLYIELLDFKVQSLIYQNSLSSVSLLLSEAIKIAKEINDEPRLFSLYYNRADLNEHIGFRCDREEFFEECTKGVNISRKYYEKSLVIVRKFKWNFLEKNLKNDVHTLNEVQTRLINQRKERKKEEELDKQYIKAIHPKSASDVMAKNNLFVIPHIGTTKELKELNETIQRADKNIPRRSLLLGDYLSFQGKIKQALPYYLNAIKLLEEDRSDIKNISQRSDLLNDKMEFYSIPILYLLDLNKTEEAFNLLERSRSRILRELLSSKVSNNYKRVDKEIFLKEPTLKEVQDNLKKENYEILEYFLVKDQIILWHISKDKVNVINIFQPYREVEKKVSSIYKTLKGKNKKFDFDVNSSKELFLLLINPILKNIKSKHLIIVPHYKLNQLPFQVLINPENNESLSEDFQISYAPSVSLLMNFKGIKNIQDRKILAIGDTSMSSGIKEIDSIESLYPKNTTKVIDHLVTKEELFKKIKGQTIIHLSVHGEYNTTSPMSSHLKLAPRGSNGYLTAFEMFSLPLEKNSLVVLSACETGKVKSTRSNETLGITRALLYAGADALLLSSWKVDEEATALWMETFYRVAKTESLVEASRQAIIKVKNIPKYSHPHYWAGFSITGK